MCIICLISEQYLFVLMVYISNTFNPVSEKDSNNDILWTWTYPSISPEYQALIISKCGLDNGASHGHNLVSFYYCHHQQYWFYLRFTDANELSCLPRVTYFIFS